MPTTATTWGGHEVTIATDAEIKARPVVKGWKSSVKVENERAAQRGKDRREEFEAIAWLLENGCPPAPLTP
jgi:hypothetical protein